LPLFRLLSISHSRLYFNGPARKKKEEIAGKNREKTAFPKGAGRPMAPDGKAALDKEKRSRL